MSRSKQQRKNQTMKLFRQRNQKLRALGFASYEDYIKSDSWRRRRSAFFSRHRRRCRVCGATGGLFLHHYTYIRVGREPDGDLVPLCGRCHSVAHSCATTFNRRLVAEMREAFERHGDPSIAVRQRHLALGQSAPVRITFMGGSEDGVEL